MPFGIKLFGASFHEGYYQIPNLGRAFLAITNFHDGLLIRLSMEVILLRQEPLWILKRYGKECPLLAIHSSYDSNV